ncbi:uncharacterized protein ACRADG_005328 isoform 2-T2 [Cochliomyia hominivorax]
MEPLKPQETEEVNTENNPIITSKETGEVIIHLEGTHTTDTQTENPITKEKKNVKFEDEAETEMEEQIEENSAEIEITNEEHKDLEINHELQEVCVINDKSNEAKISDMKKKLFEEEKSVTPSYLDAPKLPEIPNENLEISQRFKQIMNMFDNFTKNLETLDLATKPITMRSIKRKRPGNERLSAEVYFEEPKKHRSRKEEYLMDEFKKEALQSCSGSINASSEVLIARQHFEKYLRQQEMDLKDLEHITKEARSISVATNSCELKTLGCQTQLRSYDLSLMEVSSLSSQPEQSNSLNNYAQAENACNSNYEPQPDISEKPLKEAITEQPRPASEPVVPPRFNVITIEANPLPPADDLRRPPLCHRMWTVVGDFCAATFLCLQLSFITLSV